MDTTVDGRSPMRPRQLHDLRLLPTATDPRPMFVWSAEGDRNNPVTYSEYPKLLWHAETHAEVTVTSKEEEAQRLASGYVALPPSAMTVDPVQNLADQLAGLSDEEQKLILEAQQRIRREALTAKLSSLSDADLERLLAGGKRSRKAKVA